MLKKIGLAGFLFFFVKGLLWLAIPAVIALASTLGGDDEADAAAQPAPETASQPDATSTEGDLP